MRNAKGEKIMTEKITKKTMFETIKAAADAIATDVVSVEAIVEFCDAQIDQIDKKAAKAKEKAAEKKAANDELTEVVASILTNEFQTADEITAKIDGEDVSRAKVINRLTKLIGAGTAVKDTVKIEKSTKTVYKLAD